jgi:hypothetical protein
MGNGNASENKLLYLIEQNRARASQRCNQFQKETMNYLEEHVVFSGQLI